MIVKMLTHIHIMVYTWWCWHIYKGDEVGVDVDQLGDETEARRVRNSTGALQKRQGLTEWTRRWSRGDRTLGSCVRSVAAESVQASVFDRTLALKVTGRWQGASSQANVGDTKMVEKDRTLMLCPIMTDRTCLVTVEQL